MLGSEDKLPRMSYGLVIAAGDGRGQGKSIRNFEVGNWIFLTLKT